MCVVMCVLGCVSVGMCGLCVLGCVCLCVVMCGHTVFRSPIDSTDAQIINKLSVDTVNYNLWLRLGLGVDLTCCHSVNN